MYIALDKEQKRISIHDAVQGDTFFCPVCLEKMFVKSGTERARHFSHFPNCECNDSWNGQYDMSDWHYEWQNQFPPENQEVVVQCDDIRHRADVLTDRTVVEFQHSPLSSGKFNDRNVFYHGNIGYKVVWLYDMRDDYANDQMTEKTANCFLWDKPRLTFRKYDLRAGEIDLFFQIKDEGECILHIQVFTNDGFEIKQRYTKEAFLSYVGLRNGICLPPLHLDTQVNEDYLAFAEKYSIKLNPQQQRAVQAVSGANLMISKYWYNSYAKEKELDIGKVDILYSLAVREETVSTPDKIIAFIPIHTSSSTIIAPLVEEGSISPKKNTSYG